MKWESDKCEGDRLMGMCTSVSGADNRARGDSLSESAILFSPGRKVSPSIAQRCFVVGVRHLRPWKKQYSARLPHTRMYVLCLHPY